MSLCMGCMTEKGDSAICPSCGLNEEELAGSNNAFLKPGTTLRDRYLFGIALGQGGFGITYIGYDNVLNTKVAIKEFYPSDIAGRNIPTDNVSAFTNNEEIYRKGRERFLEEAKTLAKFSDHPCIVGVKDCFEMNNTAYMVMEFLEGVNLKEYLNRKGGKVSVDAAISILTPVMDALRAVHGVGIIHRDISPDNIFITTDGRVRLIDFGAARQSFDGHKSLSIMLKPGYAPEEQYRTRGNQGSWTDVYALTATFYRMITGTVPPDSLERAMEDTLEIPMELPDHIKAALSHGLAVRAAERFSSITQLQSALSGNVVEVERKENNFNKADNRNTVNVNEYRENSGSGIKIMIGVLIALIVVALGFIIGLLAVNMNEKAEPVPQPAPVAEPLPEPEPEPTPEELVEDAVRLCLEGYVEAVNTGDTSEVYLYVDTEAPYYNTEVNQIISYHNKGVREELISWELVSIEWLDDNYERCKIVQHSVIDVTRPSGTKRADETYSYLLRKKDDRYVYVKMYE